MKMCVVSFMYHEYFLKISLHQTCAVRCKVFWTENIPSAPYVRTIWDIFGPKNCASYPTHLMKAYFQKVFMIDKGANTHFY